MQKGSSQSQGCSQPHAAELGYPFDRVLLMEHGRSPSPSASNAHHFSCLNHTTSHLGGKLDTLAPREGCGSLVPDEPGAFQTPHPKTHPAGAGSVLPHPSPHLSSFPGRERRLSGRRRLRLPLLAPPCCLISCSPGGRGRGRERFCWEPILAIHPLGPAEPPPALRDAGEGPGRPGAGGRCGAGARGSGSGSGSAVGPGGKRERGRG